MSTVLVYNSRGASNSKNALHHYYTSNYYQNAHLTMSSVLSGPEGGRMLPSAALLDTNVEFLLNGGGSIIESPGNSGTVGQYGFWTGDWRVSA